VTSGRLRVVATTTQVQDFVRVVGGNRVDVVGLLKPNVDPHDYEPSPADTDAVARARVIVRSGVGIDRWLDPLIRSAETDGTVVDASTGVELRKLHGQPDPHIWHDPRNAEKMAITVERALVRADPAGGSIYARNLATYLNELGALDVEIQSSLAPLTNRKLVTDHDAFGYYAARYGLQIVGAVIPSFDSSAELSASDVSDLVTTIRREQVRAVFSEQSLSGKTASLIASEAGVRVISGPGALYGDTLGPAGSDGATYLGMMRHNTATIVRGLS